MSPLAYSRIPQIAAKVPAVTAAALAKTAHDVELGAKRTAPVDTGHLRASIAAGGGGLTWRVTAAAGYAAYVELGTSKMSAQPYLVPALRTEFPKLVRYLRALV